MGSFLRMTLIYTDANAARYMGDAFADRPLSAEYQQSIVIVH